MILTEQKLSFREKFTNRQLQEQKSSLAYK